MTKIAFMITSTGWGGLEMNTIKLAESLSAKGYHITLISQEKSTIYRKGKNSFEAVILLRKNRKYLDFTAAKALGKALKEQGINTLLLFDNKDLDVVAWTKKLFYKELHVLYQQHMQLGINKKDFIHTFRFKAIDYWISPLRYLQKEVLERTKVPADKIKVIPICLDVSKYTRQKYTRQEALQLLQLKPKAPLIGIIGRISKNKGQLFLVNALLKLKQMGLDFELLIFGSATINDPEGELYYNSILGTVKQHKLEEMVHFVAHQEDVALFYNAIDVFALASRSETYGMVTIEAMLSKLPIIATRSGGTSEILDAGRLGLLYGYDNQEEFCQKVSWLLQNKTEAGHMAALAQEIAREKYALHNEVDGIDALIKEVRKEVQLHH